MGTSPSPGWPHLQKTGLERRQRQRRPEQGGVRAGGGQARTESHETSLPSPGRGQKSQIPKMTERPGAGPHPAAPSPGGTRLRLPRPDGQAARPLQEVPHGRAASAPHTSDRGVPGPSPGATRDVICETSMCARALGWRRGREDRRKNLPPRRGSPSQFPTPNSCHVATFPPPSAPARPASGPGSYSRRTQSHSGLLKCECAGSQVLRHKQSAFYSDVPEVGVTPSSTEH